ncbi:myelin-associated glycoprotein-like [Acipenser ruthenus]|uniref:myelin-associated glycoprotein-like n=1 Tax=Acipenser ruthenus TaxID=7906 RepID=UPI0027426715|nr:myelin-associated glycoprotein-like [Acipenser ruthenus]
MIATEKLLLISCLFQGIICNEFKAFMPQRIKALSGSCVLIPCTFTIEERLESAMVEPARGIWMTSYNFRHIVFDSSRHYGENTLKAELLGKVTNKNCTTIIHHLKTSDSKSYFLRADPPKYTFRENVTLEVVDSPDRPAISPSSEVKEGAPTSLACTAPAPCPREPPALVWSDTLDGSVEIEQVEQQDGTKAVSSVLTFTASHLHHNKDITCTAQYPVGSESKSAGKVSTLHVLYSPKNTLVLINPSGEIHEGDHVTLSCSSNANPAVSRYTWFKVKGDNINEKSAEQNLTFTDIDPSDSGLYYCEARNEHGAENSTAVQLNVAFLEIASLTNSVKQASVKHSLFRSTSEIPEQTCAFTDFQFGSLKTHKNMIATEKLLLISCLFQGIICNEFKVFMPQRIKALSGSCVLIPCTFTIEERFENDMIEPARGIWRTSLYSGNVFDSSKDYGENTLKAELLGNVTNKNCTTIIHHLKTSDSKSYFFRAEPPKYNFYPSVSIEIVDSPDRPAISPSSAVKERAPTSLACTAPAPCPREPPAVVWSDTLDGSVEIEQVEQQDGTKAVSSVLTFTASHLHHNKDITCTAQYPVESETKSAEEVSTLHVLYSPKNTLVLINPSGEIHEGDHVTLSCSSNANPAVSRYTWFKVKGDNITEKSVEQDLTFTDINPSDSGLYYCEARNEHGAENSTAVQLNVACMPQISHESSCSKDDTESITCICVSRGSPSPITEWRIAGNKLENNTDRGSISNSKLEDHTMRSTLILLESLAKNEAIQCLSKNRIGTASFQFHVFHEQKEAPATPCIYVVMGTAAVQMLSTILVFVFIMKRYVFER